MPRKRETKAGRLNPVDVRSKADVGAFEGLLGKGPLTIVLVYADWCGHCQTFKEKMWNEVNTMPNKKLNTASVHYDMVENTSIKNAKIDGYPSLLLVGTDKEAATFDTEEGKTSAMPTPKSVTELKNMVNTPVTAPVKNANTMASTVVNNASNNSLSETTDLDNNFVTPNTNTNTNTTPRAAKQVNSYVPNNNLAEVEVPNTDLDYKRKDTLLPETQGVQKGGSETLLAALTKITAEAGHVGALFLAATEYADLGKRLTRRFKKRSKKTAKRKQRR